MRTFSHRLIDVLSINSLYCPEGGCFTFQFLPISRQKQNGRVIRFAERWAVEGLVCVPERSVTMAEYTISSRVDGDVLKVFWSYCSVVGFIKVPRDNKSCIWVRGHNGLSAGCTGAR